jgi:hypothetical protein
MKLQILIEPSDEGGGSLMRYEFSIQENALRKAFSNC